MTESDTIKTILEEQTSKDEVEHILNPTKRCKEYIKITTCKHCGNSSIQKIVDQNHGAFHFENGQLITRAAIYCENCHQLYFEFASMKDMELNL